MKINKGYKFRIYPTCNQKIAFKQSFGACRFIYNYLLDVRSKSWKEHKISISCFESIKMLPVLKKSYLWLKDINSQSLQQTVINLEAAFQRFFKKVSGAKYPQFKKKRDNHQSFTVPQSFSLTASKRGNWFLTIPKLKGKIKVKAHREVLGSIKTAIISRNPDGNYYVAFSVEVEHQPQEKTVSKEVGIDLGLKDFLVTSEGVKLKPSKYYRLLERKLKGKQRDLSRRKISSSNWTKIKHKIAVLHQKITNQRNNFLHKISSKLVHENQIIYVEDLNVKGMMKNRKLAKSIADVGWGEFGRQLKYKGLWYNTSIVKIGRFEPSSKLCSGCGYKNMDLKLSDRVWICPICGIQHDRDINAAVNIKKIGQDMPNSKSVEKSTSVFSLKKRQAGSVKQKPIPKLS